MKSTSVLAFFLLLLNASAYSQADRVTIRAATLNRDSTRNYFLSADTFGNLNFLRQIPFSNAIIPYDANADWVKDTINSVGDLRYYPVNNPNGYISGVDSLDVVGALGYEPSKFSGSYHNLLDTPDLFDGQYNSLTGKPDLFGGSYHDLTDTPHIPTNNNQLINGANYITSTQAPVQSVNGQTGNVNLILGDSVAFYNSSGKINQKIKVFTQSYTPNTGNGYSMDISAAGFSTILSVQLTSEYNTSNAGNVHNYELKSVSTSAVVVNITTPNAVTVLGVSVLGLPTFIGSGTGTTIHLTVIGY